MQISDMGRCKQTVKKKSDMGSKWEWGIKTCSVNPDFDSSVMAQQSNHMEQ